MKPTESVDVTLARLKVELSAATRALALARRPLDKVRAGGRVAELIRAIRSHSERDSAAP